MAKNMTIKIINTYYESAKLAASTNADVDMHASILNAEAILLNRHSIWFKNIKLVLIGGWVISGIICFTFFGPVQTDINDDMVLEQVHDEPTQTNTKSEIDVLNKLSLTEKEVIIEEERIQEDTVSAITYEKFLNKSLNKGE
jgi:hypothetical protein